MRGFGRWLAWHGAGAAAAALAVAASGLTPAAAQTGPVTAVPAKNTPELATTGTVEQVRQGALTAWDSTEFSKHCTRHAFNLTAAAWSPDSSTVYVVSTGHSPVGWNGTFPLTGLCGAVAAFPATQHSGLTPTWVNYTGCDSLYSVAADASAVYVAGTERWADDSGGCDSAGPGSVPAPGMGGFTPATGALLENSGGTAGLYSRARGLGADDMLLTGAGLWIASDNLAGSATCGGVAGHAGICLLPYA